MNHRPAPGASVLAFLFALFLLPASALAQDKDWRPIAPEDIQSKAPVVEPDADAEAIFWDVRIDNSGDGFSRSHYVRVKIFTERGRERYSKFDIPFVRGLKIKDLAARVIKTDGTIVEIGKNDIFEREIVKASGIKVKAKSFAVPNIEPGVIVEYRYKESFGNGNAVGSKLDFQKEIPVRQLSYYYKPYQKGEPSFRTYNFNDTKFVKDSDGFYLARRSNIPAFKPEPRMPPENNVRPWIQLTGTSASITNFSMNGFSYVVKDQSNPSKYWGGVGTEKLAYVRAMISAAKEVKSTAEEVVVGAATDEEKLLKLYQFCQKNIKNTSYDPSITDEMRAKLPEFKGYKEMIKDGSGTYFQINMLFGAMAQAVGLSPRYVLAGDRSEMLFDPTMTDDDLVSFAGIGFMNGETLKVYNPGIKYAPFGVLPWHRTGTWALSVGEKTFSWTETPLVPHDQSSLKRVANFKLNEDGSLEGNIRLELNGLRALEYRLGNYDESLDSQITGIKASVTRRISQAEITDVSVENMEDTSKPLVQQYKVRVPNYAEKTGKRLFLAPGFFEFHEAPVFSNSTRKYDVNFGYPWSEFDDIVITYPSNYALDNADAPAPIADSAKIGSDVVEIGVDPKTSTLRYQRRFYFGGGGKVLFKPEYYTPLKALFDAFNKVDTHQLSLKQK